MSRSQVAKAVLASDDRPWRTVGGLLTTKEPIAKFVISGEDPKELKTRADAVLAELQEDGFDAEREDPRMVLQESLGTALTVFTIALVMVDLALKGPEAAKKFRSWLQNRGDTKLARLGPQGLEWLLSDWLDERYGAGKWQYDPDACQAKELADAWVVDLTETNSGTRHLLLTNGARTEELPLDWRKFNPPPLTGISASPGKPGWR